MQVSHLKFSKNVTVIFILSLLSLMLFDSCQGIKNDKGDVFSEYYLKLSKTNTAEFDSLVSYYRELDSVLRRHHSPLMQFLKVTTEARMSFRQSEYEKSTRKYKDALELISDIKGTDSLRAMTYMGLGINYMNLSEFDTSFVYYTKALQFYETQDNRYMLNIVRANMAQAYYYKRDEKKAFELLNKVIADSITNAVKIKAMHLKANILGSSGSIDSAIAIDREAIRKFGTNENRFQMTSIYNNLGLCYLHKNMPDSALFYCKKSYQIDSLLGIKVNTGANLALLGDIYQRLNQPEVAAKYYNDALKIFVDGNNYDRILWLYEAKLKDAREKNNMPEIVRLQDSVYNMYKTMNNHDVNRTIELLNIEYETSKKLQQIENQKVELRNRNLALILGGVSGLLIISSLVFYFVNRNKRQRLMLLEKDRNISAMIVEAEQNERSRIAGELHDSVSQKLAYVNMQLSSEESSGITSDLLQQAMNEVRSISHNLYPVDLEKGIIPALTYLCEQNNFANQTMKFELKTDHSLYDHAAGKNIELILFRIIQEITHNARKYSQATLVTISIFKTNNRIDLEVTDNGNGFDVSELSKTKGIGIRNMENRVHQIGGKFQLISFPGKGTTYAINLTF